MVAIKPLGLDHVVIRVADLKRARAWYTAVLGCKVERILPSLGLTQLRVGLSLIDLVEVKWPLGKKGGRPPRSTQFNMDHFCVQLAEFNEQKICAHLKRKGIKTGNVERRYGALGHGPSMYLTDPDGNSLELKGPPDLDQSERIPDAIRPKRRRKFAR